LVRNIGGWSAPNIAAAHAYWLENLDIAGGILAEPRRFCGA
jgi:hypothetical protein